jgi:hypothetical protein
VIPTTKGNTMINGNKAVHGGGIYNLGVVVLNGAKLNGNKPDNCLNTGGGTGC